MDKETIKEEVQETAEQETTKEETKETQTVAIDYDKIEKILEGRQKANEESVLKGYFKQQGLSQEEMKTAIEAFKKQKAESTPDLNAMQSEISQATERMVEAEMRTEAMLMAAELGIDIKAMPFIIRMADTNEVTANGMIDKDKLKASLEQVIEAIPALKQTSNQGGFQVVGAETSTKKEADDDDLYRIFGVNKK